MSFSCWSNIVTRVESQGGSTRVSSVFDWRYQTSRDKLISLLQNIIMAVIFYSTLVVRSARTFFYKTFYKCHYFIILLNQTKVLVTVSQFHPNLIFEGQSRPFSILRVGDQACRKYQLLEATDSDKTLQSITLQS